MSIFLVGTLEFSVEAQTYALFRRRASRMTSSYLLDRSTEHTIDKIAAVSYLQFAEVTRMYKRDAPTTRRITDIREHEVIRKRGDPLLILLFAKCAIELFSRRYFPHIEIGFLCLYLNFASIFLINSASIAHVV